MIVTERSRFKSSGRGRAIIPTNCFSLALERYASSRPNTMSVRSYRRANAMYVNAMITRNADDPNSRAAVSSRVKSARFSVNAIRA